MRKNESHRRAAILVLAGSFLFASPARAGGDLYELADVEVFGSSRVTTALIEEKYADVIRSCLQAMRYTGKSSKKKVEEFRTILGEGVRRLGGFGWTRLEVVKLRRKNAGDRARPVLLLFDVIEKKDMATRLPYRSPPKMTIKDTSGLLELYSQYDKTGWDLVNKNQLSVDRQDCPAFFCTFGSATEALRELETRFVNEVPSYRELLERITRGDRDFLRRSQALYLLTYFPDGPVVSNLVSQALLDPSDQVREAAMSIITDMAVHHPDVPIPVHVGLRMLDFPYADDRNRALALMLSIASNADYRSFMIHSAAEKIIRLLRSKHPVTHNNAYIALTLLSGKDYGERDYDAWDRWLWGAKRGEGETKKKKFFGLW